MIDLTVASSSFRLRLLLKWWESSPKMRILTLIAEGEGVYLLISLMWGSR